MLQQVVNAHQEWEMEQKEKFNEIVKKELEKEFQKIFQEENELIKKGNSFSGYIVPAPQGAGKDFNIKGLVYLGRYSSEMMQYIMISSYPLYKEIKYILNEYTKKTGKALALSPGKSFLFFKKEGIHF